ncbi:MAG: GDP-L-fucose synthase [Legionella sp.]|uniref:GDP-L-fucose synthase family protein n=1 Tax=Legionella sp. TaxID=459 RepID=UPI0039E513D4
MTGIAQFKNGSNVSCLNGKRIWITGHQGMLGSALVRLLQKDGANLLLTTREELDLQNQQAVFQWVDENRPELIFHIGAKVGGIYANCNFRADFLHSNLMIQSNVINAAHQFEIQKLLFVASNCIYPTNARQPISEDALLLGPLEDNIRSYAVAKIAGIEMCQAYRKQYNRNFISIIPPNLYGPGDNYHPHHSHVVAGILKRAHEAKYSGAPNFVVWGDGSARREILHVDDLAAALKHLMFTEVSDDVFNVGCGHDFLIADLARLIAEVVGYQGAIIFDSSKPNGTMRKLLDSSRIRATGWAPQINEIIGLQSAYQDFIARLESKTHERFKSELFTC